MSSPRCAVLATAIVTVLLTASWPAAGEFTHVRTSTFGGSGSLGTQAARVALDTDGNIFLTGEIFDVSDFDTGPGEALREGRASAFVARWAPDHSYGWAVVFGDIRDTHAMKAEGFSIAADIRGRVYVSGETLGKVDMDPGPATLDDINASQGGAFLSCFNATNGALIWSRITDDWYREIGYGVAVDTNHGVYMAGKWGSEELDFDPTAGTDVRTNATYPSYANSGFVTKFGDDGSYGWTRTFGGSRFFGNAAYDVAATPAGLVYVTGYYYGTDTDFDDGAGTLTGTAGAFGTFLLALDTEGAIRWLRTWADTKALQTYGIEVHTSAAGVFVAGAFAGVVDFDPGPATDSRDARDGNHCIVHYSHEGEYQWVRTIPADFEPKEVHFSPGLAVDADNTVYYTGRYDNSGAGVDFDTGSGTDIRYGPGIFLTQINPDGSYGGTACMTQTLDKVTSRGNALDVDPQGRIVIFGYLEGGIDFDPGPGTEIHVTTNYHKSFVSTFSRATDDGYALRVASTYGGTTVATGTHWYAAGATVRCEVTNSPVAGGAGIRQTCLGWTGTGSVTNGTGTVVELTLQTNSALTWLWHTQYEATVTADTGGAVAFANGWYDPFTELEATATAHDYHQFTAWNGTLTSTSNPISFSLIQPHALVATFTPDLATNRTPKYWLAAHGLTGATFDAASLDDQDRDGMPTWQEWQADTDPTNPASCLRILDLQPIPDGVSIRWQGGAQARQVVERCGDPPNLPTRWIAILTNEPTTAPVTNITDTSVTNQPLFYRIRASRP